MIIKVLLHINRHSLHISNFISVIKQFILRYFNNHRHIKYTLLFSGIEVKFKGFGRVHWTEDRSVTVDGKSETETVHYNSSETYYTMEYRVWGNG